jgi:hypothetical protein
MNNQEIAKKIAKVIHDIVEPHSLPITEGLFDITAMTKHATNVSDGSFIVFAFATHKEGGGMTDEEVETRYFRVSVESVANPNEA